MKIYPVTPDQAWEIAKTVFRWEGSDAIEEHKDEGYMLTSSGVNMVSWGAVMGAWIEPFDKDHTKVTVVTKRRLSITLSKTGTPGMALSVRQWAVPACLFSFLSDTLLSVPSDKIEYNS